MNVLFLVLSICCSIEALALTPDEIRSEIQSQASKRHPDDPGEFWGRLGPEALPVLKQMFAENPPPLLKTWVIDGLSRFNDPSVGPLLQSAVTSSDNAVMKKKMLAALIQSQGDAVLGFVEPYLKDTDPHIRLAVAKAMQAYMSPGKAQAPLAGFKEHEKESWVKSGLDTKVVPDQVKRAHSLYQKSDETKGPAKPLEEKDWVGEWKGIEVTPKKSSAANAILSRKDSKWKVEIKLPKMTRFEWNGADIDVSYFQTATEHWLQIKNKKEDAVFIAHKKATP
jgi:hypothetical protein